MNNQRLLKSGASVDALAEILRKCQGVTKYDEGKQSEAGTIAHAFCDLEESFHVFLEDHLPKLTSGQLEPTQVYELLLDIGEEFRHILYHIKDPRFYQYLHNDPGKKDEAVEK